MPFTSWDANSAWAALCRAALVHWFQTQRLTGPLAIRWQLWHLPALVCETGRRVKLRLGARALLAAQHPNSPRTPHPHRSPPPTRRPARRAPTPKPRPPDLVTGPHNPGILM